MKNRSGRLALIGLMLIALFYPLTGCAAATGRTLKVGVRSDVMYWSYYSEKNNSYYGMEVDLARKIAEDLGYTDVEFVSVTPADREEKLQDGTVDCIIACFSITPERQERVDFSPAYYMDHAVILAEDTTLFTSFDNLLGQHVGVLKGSDAEQNFIDAMTKAGLLSSTDMKNTVIDRFDTYADMFAALDEGGISAVAVDDSIAHKYVASQPSIIQIGDYISDEPYGVATVKGSALTAKISAEVTKLMDDGTMDKFISKWY